MLNENKRNKDGDDFHDEDDTDSKKILMSAFGKSIQKSSSVTRNSMWKKGDRESGCRDISRLCMQMHFLLIWSKIPTSKLF